MVETSKALESAEARAKSSTVNLEPLAKRIEELEHRATALGEVDQRVEALAETTAQAQRQAAKLISLDGELESCRHEVQQLGSQTRDTGASLEAFRRALGEGDQRVEALAETTVQAQRQAAKLISLDGEFENCKREVQQLRAQTGDTGASLEAFRRELAALEDFRNQYRQARGELKEFEQGVNQAIALRLELEQMHVVAGQLAQDYNKIHDTAREVRKDSAAASRAVREVKRKLDVQVASLDVGLKQVARGKKTLTRIDRIVEKTEARLDAAERLRDEFVRETARMEKDGHARVDLMRTFIERLAVEKQGVAAFDERLRALRGSVHDAERRMDALSANERQLESLPPRVDELSGAFQALTRRADELGERQTGLETAQEQLARVQDMAPQATAQYESLRQSQAEFDRHIARVAETAKFVEVFEGRLDALKRDHAALESLPPRVDELSGAFQALTRRADELGERQTGLEIAEEQLGRVQDMASQASAQYESLGQSQAEFDQHIARVTEAAKFVEVFEGRLDALQTAATETVKTLLGQTEELGRKQAGLGTLSEQLARVTERIQFVETLEGRLNALHAVASDVDQKVVVHRVSLETLKHERTALEEFRHELQQSHDELKQITQSMDQALAVRTELEQLAEHVNTHVEQRALEKKELEAFDQRLLVLRGSVQDAEARMKALSTQEMQLAYLPRRLEELSKMFEELMGQAHELTRNKSA